MMQIELRRSYLYWSVSSARASRCASGQPSPTRPCYRRSIFDYTTLFVFPVTLPYASLQFVCCCKKCDLPGWVSTKLYDSVVESIGTLIIREGRVVIHLAIALGIKIAVRGTSKTKN